MENAFWDFVGLFCVFSLNTGRNPMKRKSVSETYLVAYTFSQSRLK